VRYARAALLMDLADVGGNVKDGCHIASMGGTWMALAYGFGGLRDSRGHLSFRTQRPPEEQAVLQFTVTWRGQLLDVEVGRDSTTYRLREGNMLTIWHEEEEITLTQARPTMVCPTVQPLEVSR
jgi:alpha,alpha-trehalose phosphorylase